MEENHLIILKRQVKLGAGQSSAHWSALERRIRVRGGGVVYLREPQKGAAHRRCRAPF